MTTEKTKIVNWVFNVGITADADSFDYESFADVLRDAIMDYPFVTDVMDWEEEEDEDPQPNQDGRTFK